MELTFAQVEKALALTNAVAETKRSAFAYRLKHLQKLRFPPGVNTGRGKAAAYDVGHLYLLGVALELNQLGLTPERTVNVINQNTLTIAQAGLEAAREGPPKGSYPAPMLLYFDPANLSDLMIQTHNEDRASRSFHFGSLGQAQKDLRWWTKGGLSRVSFFSVSALLHHLAGYSPGREDRRQFYDALTTWCEDKIQELHSHGDN